MKSANAGPCHSIWLLSDSRGWALQVWCYRMRSESACSTLKRLKTKQTVPTCWSKHVTNDILLLSQVVYICHKHRKMTSFPSENWHWKIDGFQKFSIPKYLMFKACQPNHENMFLSSYLQHPAAYRWVDREVKIFKLKQTAKKSSERMTGAAPASRGGNSNVFYVHPDP